MSEYSTSTKILGPAALQRKLAMWRHQEQRIVFTNGVFDLLHLGHVDYLERAAALGDVLLVGLNTDASVARLKPGRPLQAEAARARVLAALEFVEAVTLFDEDTPEALIGLVQPDILVKGADYQVHQIAGADAVLARGGQVLTLDLIPGYSTTDLVARIRG